LRQVLFRHLGLGRRDLGWDRRDYRHTEAAADTLELLVSHMVVEGTENEDKELAHPAAGTERGNVPVRERMGVVEDTLAVGSLAVGNLGQEDIGFDLLEEDIAAGLRRVAVGIVEVDLRNSRYWT